MTQTTRTSIDWNETLVEQADWHWKNQLRARFEGLTDDEYFWEPVPGAWNVHRRGEGSTEIQGGTGAMTIDWAYPAPEPTPVTTIAWRLAHIVVGVLGARAHHHFGAPEADYFTFDYAATADQALAQLDSAYAAWFDGVRSWGAEGLAEPCGPAEGPFADASRATLVLHINRELIHHGAEIALLRDLWAHRTA